MNFNYDIYRAMQVISDQRPGYTTAESYYEGSRARSSPTPSGRTSSAPTAATP
jgi:hypothetical protein